MSDDDLQAVVAANYVALGELLEALPAERWETSSLCEGWRVREVVAHLTMPARYSQDEFMAELRDELRNATLVVQDWGGPIGLSALAAFPERFARIFATNTILHTSDPDLSEALTWANFGLGEGRVVLEEALVDYVLFCQRTPDLVPSVIVDAIAGPLPPAVRAAYEAPFPEPIYKAGLRQMSSLTPLTRNDPGAAIGRTTWNVLRRWERPFLTAYSDADPATAGWDTVFQERVPGARGQAHTIIRGPGHFVQEQEGEQLGRIIVDFINAT